LDFFCFEAIEEGSSAEEVKKILAPEK